MALAPHWLDTAFTNTNEYEIIHRMTVLPEFTKAIHKAIAAYKEAEKLFKDNPKHVGPSPAQNARKAFLEGLRQEGHEESEQGT